MTALLLSLVIAQSTIYAWVDRSGLEHFTDDLNSVPKGVKVRTTAGVDISRIESDVVQSPLPVAPVAVVAQPGVPSNAEQLWRQLFKDARTRVVVLEEDIEADRKQIEEVNGMPVNARFTCATGWWGLPTGFASTTGAQVTLGGQPLPGLGVTTSVTGTAVVHQTPLFVAPCAFGFNPEFERVRERLSKNRRELVRAKEDLADLERRASFEAVPLHWRR